MIFQCDDLDRALEFPELLPDARAHAATCLRCRDQLDLWDEISNVAPQLQEHWESPGLWPRIQSEITIVMPRRRPVRAWHWALAAAASLMIAALLWQTQALRHGSPTHELLTEETLREVQQAESAYVRSIDKLSTVAGASLDRSTAPVAGAYREKLVILDSAIAEAKTAAGGNRYNAYVQTQLASLYHEKQKTLQEWLENAKNN